MKARVRVAKSNAGSWWITCSACKYGEDFFDFWPWATAATHATAMLWALWHVERHRLTTCGTCSHMPAIPKPRPFDEDRSLVRVGDETYRTSPTKIVRIG